MLGVFGPKTVDFVDVVRVTQMHFMGSDAYNRSCNTLVSVSTSGYIVCTVLLMEPLDL